MKLILFLFILLLVQCNSTHSYFQNKPISVDLTLLNETFINPKSLTVIGNNIVFIDTKEDHFIHIYNIVKEKEVFAGFYIGRGPREMLAPFSITEKRKDEFWTHDYIRKSFYQYYLRNDSALMGNKISFPDIRIIYPCFLNDSAIIAVNLQDISKGWLSKFDANGKFLNPFIRFPENSSNIPVQVFIESLQGILAIKPDKQRIVFACRYTDKLQIFSKDGAFVNEYRTSKPFQPIIDVVSSKYGWIMGQTEETRFAFVSLTVSNEHIFALFSGKANKNNKFPNYGNFILQLNWNGVLQKVIHLDYPAISISWSQHYQRLYFKIIIGNKFRIAFIEI